MKRPKNWIEAKWAKTTQALKDELAAEHGGEFRIHSDIINLLRKSQMPGVWYWHTPNGIKLTPGQASKFRAMGVVAGISDIIIAVPGKMIFMEVKSRKGRTSAEQQAFLEAMEALGHISCVVRNLDQATAILSRWGAIRPVHTMRIAA